MFRGKINIPGILGVSFVFAFLLILAESPDTSAYTATLSITGSNSTDIVPKASGNANTSVTTNEINVITNCRAGYNLTVSAPNDRNLYKDGNSSNNTQGQYLSPVDGSSALNNTSNAWGYSLTANTESGVFSPLPNTPATLRTPSGTASQTDIDDTIPVYYGVSVSSDLAPGQYRMANNGAIVYQLTMDDSCSGFTVAFNANGGTGTMSSQEIKMGEATKLTANSFTAPTLGTSYQNDDGTTIPGVANKLWTFWGWNTKADGTGDWYKDREQITNLTAEGYNITLYAQWKQATLADLVASTPSGNQKVINHNTMQDMSAGACYNSDKFTTVGTPYGQATLTDNRDGINKTYTVARLPDGYCWMTQNLNLGTSTTVTLTSDDTDLSEGTTFTLPASSPTDYSSSSLESNVNKPTVLNDMTIPDYTVNSTTYSNKIGAYYSFAAATADTNTYSKTDSNTLIATSICPKNWDLPTTAQFNTLKTKGSIAAYNNTSASYAGRNAGNEPYYFIYGGYRRDQGDTINTSNFYNPTTQGYLWTANNYSNNSARSAYAYSSGLYYSGINFKSYGMGIRCLANMNDASHKITFVNTDGGATQEEFIIIGESGTAKPYITWTRSGYKLGGWDTNSTGSNTVYTDGQTITPSSDLTVYTVWKPTYTIVYNINTTDSNATGAMGQTHTNIAENDSVTLIAPNYSRTNYGFAGWSFDSNAQPGGAARIYGPNEVIDAPAPSTPGETKTLYAIWVQSAGNLQEWNGCSSMSVGDITALKDTRDNNVYTVGKLVDDNCWMMENLRLDNTYSNDSSKAQGFGGVFAGLAETEWISSNTNANSLYYSGTQSGTATIDIGTANSPAERFPRYNNQNTRSRDANPTSFNARLYGYSNYYSWAAAKANTDSFTYSTDGDKAYTSICPSGWKLPYGSNSGNGNKSGGFYYLNYKINNNSNTTSSVASRRIRAYPNNFIYSGHLESDRGQQGAYWSGTGKQILRIDNSTVYPGTMNVSTKGIAYSIRCLAEKGLQIQLRFNDGTNRIGGRVYGQAGSTLNLPTLTRDGYVLSSWNTAADGSGASYTSSYTFDASATTRVILYAQWTPQ